MIANTYDKTDVIAACDRALALIKKEREHRVEQIIANEMKKKKYFFLRNFTREEAIARLQEVRDNGVPSEFEMAETFCTLWEDRVKDIKTAVSHCTKNSVSLSISEVNQLCWKDPQ